MRFALRFMLLLLIAMSGGRAATIPIISLKATYAENAASFLPKVIDGRDGGEQGWSVYPRTEEAHSLMAQIAPTRALAFDLVFCFLSGQPKRYFGCFKLYLTTDPHVGIESKWQQVSPQSVSAMGTTLSVQQDGLITASEGDTMIGNAIMQLRVQSPVGAVTGFRVEAIPFERPNVRGKRMSWNEYRDFCLTEWRIESIQAAPSTNIALGCPVTASHPLWAKGSAGVLTDGLPGSFTHPADINLGSGFHFDIDLGAERHFDHLIIQGRADGFGTNHLSRLKVQVFGEKDHDLIAPNWEYIAPAEAGSTATLRGSDARGTFAGRYVRISSDSGISRAPQVAEVEVYPRLTPVVHSILADGQPVQLDNTRIPAGTALLRIAIDVPGEEASGKPLLRWRLRGIQDEWMSTYDRVLEIARPTPGKFRFEAQVGHSDKEWDGSVLILPVEVRPHLWEIPLFQWGVPCVAVAAALAISRRISKQREARKLAALKNKTALAEERGRIARDMHDEVGARLCQLALMQDLLLTEHPLPEKARDTLVEISKNTRDTVDALDQVVWAVNPQHDSLDGVANYLTHAATSYLTPLNIICRLDVPFEWPKVIVRAQMRHHLILSFREALQNVVKHAGATTVHFSMRYEAPLLRMVIRDNGVGIGALPNGGGHDGIANMKERLAAIGGTCEIRRSAEGGTEVEMHAPLIQEERP